MKNEFYVYLHRKSDTQEVFYVGKGCGERCYSTKDRNIHWTNTANKHGFTVEIYGSGLLEDDAFELEKKLIASFGRADKGLGKLVNWTDGGEGGAGRIVTELHKKRLSKKTKEYFANPDNKKSHLEKMRSESRIKLLRDANSDHKKYDFVNKAGERLYATRREFIETTGVSPATACALILGHRKNAKDWCIGEYVSNKKVGRTVAKERHLFVHDDGRKVVMTQREMIETFGVPVTKICQVVNGKRNKTLGWTCAQVNYKEAA